MAEKIWLKRVLIPLWILQLLALIVLLAAEAISFWIIDDAHDDAQFDNANEGDVDNAFHAINAVVAIIMVVTCLTFIMNIVEIVLVARRKLKPVAFVVMQCIKTFVWTVFFVLLIIGIARAGASGVSIFLGLVMFLTCLAQLIYGSVILRRYKKGTLYGNNAALPEIGHADPYAGHYNQPPQVYQAPIVPASYYRQGDYEMQNGGGRY